MGSNPLPTEKQFTLIAPAHNNSPRRSDRQFSFIGERLHLRAVLQGLSCLRLPIASPNPCDVGSDVFKRHPFVVHCSDGSNASKFERGQLLQLPNDCWRDVLARIAEEKSSWATLLTLFYREITVISEAGYIRQNTYRIISRAVAQSVSPLGIPTTGQGTNPFLGPFLVHVECLIRINRSDPST